MGDRDISSWPRFSEDEIGVVSAVLESGRVNQWTGQECARFEEEYAEHCDVRYAIALANGTVSLELALEALGIGRGDDVIVTPRSFVASASCVVRVGARPVFADVDPDSQNLTAESIARALTAVTRAVIVVHHAGWPCDMEPIMQVARENQLFVVEDCAQAHGATYKGRPVGGIGHIGSFSFCQDKIISTGGEGGMLVLNDEETWARAWSIKDHGKNRDTVFSEDHPPGFRWVHDTIGTNWRMTEMQAAIGRVQLRKLPEWVARRRSNAERLAGALSQYAAVRVPSPGEDVGHAYYRLYAFLDLTKLKDGWSRERILDEFQSWNVPAMAGSCPEIYREKAFVDRQLGLEQPLPVAASLGPASLAFPIHPTLTDSDLQMISDAIHNVIAAASAE